MFPAHEVPDPLVLVLFPVVIEAKSSLRIVVPPLAVTVSVNAAEPVPAEFVAEMVALDVPAAAGVPEMMPVDVFTVRPVGRPDAANDVGEFDAVI